ncbi:AraC family transcriptional regulator [Novosphingobium cyanobacteriorum]|uniref:AraC family transcriptional regulator n=1 Tax=Novosphingobium cyanobacteriorum TaxID=3024215 RepID=A0ABT6CKI0_9SPHN|nr:AraC family transcriptional regulator [Novosphingobium cyanobacteriorum]MDF8333768.1 AraC family transcriptional regulator [Novosphingobium cyanobacteriorum]
MLDIFEHRKTGIDGSASVELRWNGAWGLKHTPSLIPHARPVIHGRVLTAIFDAAGVSPVLRTQMLDTEELRHNDLLGADASIPLGSYMRMFERLAQILEQPTLGLDLSLRMGPELIGALGYAFMHSATLDQAIEAFASSVFSIQGVTTLSYERAAVPVVRYSIFDDRLHPRRQDVEFSLGYVHALIRRFLGHDQAPREVHFQHPRAGPRLHYEAVFGCPVYFEQSSNALVLDPGAVASRGRMHDPHLVSILQNALERGRPELDQGDTIAGAVDRLLAELIETGDASCRRVAASLGMSEATLRRKLKREGVSFRAMLRQRRCALATRYLRETDLSILQVAQLAGYAETASFTRAYIEETGVMPSMARRQRPVSGDNQ